MRFSIKRHGQVIKGDQIIAKRIKGGDPWQLNRWGDLWRTSTHNDVNLIACAIIGHLES